MQVFRIFLSNLLITGFFLAVVPATAEEAMVKLTLAGEAYEGPPAFLVDFADTKIGEGAVDKAIDTTTDGRIFKQSDWAPYTQTFTFAIPGDVFKADGTVSVKLTNDDWGGPGSNQDRTLILIHAVIDGIEVPAKDFVWMEKGETKQMPKGSKGLVLGINKAVAIANPPSGGWPSAKTAPPAPAASTEAPAEPKVPEAEETAQAAPEKPAVPADTPACTVTLSVAVTGYRSNQISVPAKAKALKDLPEKLKGQTCEITITGYSSISGPPTFNKRLSAKRAAGVAAYLKKAGVDMSKAKTASGGETSRFGKRFADNRRVVVGVAPAK
jgi:outer membrane protein OmpA-like peptidoglycan-associated protein